MHLVTRTHKHTDRDHVGLANGTAEPEQHLPRYFAKSGHVDVDPKKTKKDGGGKGNWLVLICSHHSKQTQPPPQHDITSSPQSPIPNPKKKPGH